MGVDHWLPYQLHTLMRYRKQGIKFPEIARRMGRNQVACENRYNYEMRKRREARLAGLRDKRDLADGCVPRCKDATNPSVVTESSTSAPTIGHSTLLANGADTRDIATRGASAVLFGDPPPGRSALDKRKELTDHEKPTGFRSSRATKAG